MVAVTGINREKLAQSRLTEKGFEVYYPIGKKTVRHARKEEIRTFPVFSRYVFVRSTQLWGGIIAAEGVLDILKNNWQPMEVPEEVIEDIKAREVSGQFDIISKRTKRQKWSRSFAVLKSLLNIDPSVHV